MKARSIKGETVEEISLEISNAVASGFAPTLAIVFMSVRHDRQVVIDTLKNYGIDVFGCTTSGEFSNGYEGSGSIVIMLLEISRDDYMILFEDLDEQNIDELTQSVARKALNKFSNPGFIVCSTAFTQQGAFLPGEKLVSGIVKLVGEKVPVYGGMAGDDMRLSGTFVFTNDGVINHGLIALVLNQDKITMQGMAISGWQPLGPYRTVTRSEDGWLYTIDDHPALDMYMHYLGKETLDGDDQYKIFDTVGFFYPFQVQDAGDPIMRTPFKIDKTKNALRIDFHIPEGKKLKFSMPPDFDIVEEVLESAKNFKKTISGDADALLIFSCAGRLSTMGPLTAEENDGLAEIWQAPMAGFYTYGEYGRSSDGKQVFHSTTCCWVALKEK